MKLSCREDVMKAIHLFGGWDLDYIKEQIQKGNLVIVNDDRTMILEEGKTFHFPGAKHVYGSRKHVLMIHHASDWKAKTAKYCSASLRPTTKEIKPVISVIKQVFPEIEVKEVTMAELFGKLFPEDFESTEER